MADLFSDWYDQTVQVRTAGTTDQWGATTLAAPVTAHAFVDDKVQVVASGGGTETRVVSTLYAAYSDRALYSIGSEVEMPDGRKATVQAVTGADAAVDDDLDGITVQLA